ncbi:hypothetical protein ZOSMA_292G00110 [Zostera marina]|uniref:Uncharacterized protein n=1 Tax=Zostera marina TaxID=29655 RepID=A0A0K9PBZ0_ZOSMR|nr:hypothetical protein ZOSMA_292G00110 [Zostera marina]
MVHLGTITIGGTSINPARSFGAAVIYNNHKAWTELWVFILGPLIGSFIATGFHQIIIRASNFERIVNSFATP